MKELSPTFPLRACQDCPVKRRVEGLAFRCDGTTMGVVDQRGIKSLSVDCPKSSLVYETPKANENIVTPRRSKWMLQVLRTGKI